MTRKAACGSSKRPEQNALAAHRLREFLARDDRPAHHVAMTRRVFRQAVHEDVDAVLAVVVESRERVVHHRQRARRVRNPGNARDVRDARERVGRGLEIDELGLAVRERALDAGVVLDREHRVRDPEPRERAADQAERRPVGLHEAQDVIAGAQLRYQRGRDRSGARAGRDAVVALLQLGEQHLELAGRRIGTARVEIPFALPAVEAQRLLQALEGELDRLVDGRHQRTVVRRQRRFRGMVDARAALHRGDWRARAGLRPA